MEMRNKASAGEYRKENKESVRTGGKRNKLQCGSRWIQNILRIKMLLRKKKHFEIYFTANDKKKKPTVE